MHVDTRAQPSRSVPFIRRRIADAHKTASWLFTQTTGDHANARRRRGHRSNATDAVKAARRLMRFVTTGRRRVGG